MCVFGFVNLVNLYKTVLIHPVIILLLLCCYDVFIHVIVYVFCNVVSVVTRFLKMG